MPMLRAVCGQPQPRVRRAARFVHAASRASLMGGPCLSPKLFPFPRTGGVLMRLSALGGLEKRAPLCVYGFCEQRRKRNVPSSRSVRLSVARMPSSANGWPPPVARVGAVIIIVRRAARAPPALEARALDQGVRPVLVHDGEETRCSGGRAAITVPPARSGARLDSDHGDERIREWFIGRKTPRRTRCP